VPEFAWCQPWRVERTEQKRITKSKKGNWRSIVHAKAELRIYLLSSRWSVGACTDRSKNLVAWQRHEEI
jgi:hypothetical protein